MKRRSFIQKTAAASAAFSIVPSFVLGGQHIAPSDTLYIAAVGVGGRGGGVVRDLTAYGKVKFVDVTKQANIYSSALGYGLALATSDVNNDGYIDITRPFIGYGLGSGLGCFWSDV